MIKLIKEKLNDFIKSATQLSIGKECEKFERNFAKYQKRKHSVFLNSGSSANLALIQALLNLGKLKKGDMVGFSAVTWATNPMPLIQLGLKAVPVDVELSSLNISSKTLEAIIKKYPLKALFITNLLGFCDDIDKISRICKKNKIILIEDNCESLGTVYKGKLLGNFGYASTFSFFVGHHMSTIEGGSICTDDEELATMLVLVRAHGWDRNLPPEKQIVLRKQHKTESTFYSRYTFYDLGYNLRPTEINGFIGNYQLQFIDEIISKRESNFMKLAPLIYGNVKKYYPIKYNHIDLLSNFAFPIICKSKEIRDELIVKCELQVEIRPIVGGNMTSQPFFKKYVSEFKKLDYPNAKLINEQGLYFGNNPEMTDEEISELISIFSK
ncbi:MAG: DegT/DnrJ/EryC1/StrS aminotransferase [Candidatus Roizmanbacteria bacterium GW2011_GWC2_35_12]|uniref:DegT/DnrJ/EryC1/StrS aminotransferase n=2 Tax=Candidatus Roizmaniibacteriota TaxID=1752723 RepID=A0A0G0BSN1_9BACT|nr:MAG: DegT/DnrJ/EryC1/StrS aminotransferase [Candidatus Roizmanbacteria bacterium GW2011_GWC2_35_12]